MSKKGFTLMELLGVLVILAMISLITIPIVSKTINDSQTNIDKRSLEQYVRAIETSYYNEKANNASLTPQKYIDEYLDKLEYNGDKIECETVEIEGEEIKNIELYNCSVEGRGIYNYYNGKIEGSSNSQIKQNNYLITNNLTEATNNNDLTTIKENESYSAIITPNDGYEIETISITMGGEDITSTSYNNGVITIEKVTGNIVIDVKTKETFNIEVVLPNGLTPVIYNGANWVVTTVDKKWYDYENLEWANAVILNDNVSKDENTPLNITTDVKAMFVYIPRYEYKIEGDYGKGGESLSLPGEIEVNFIRKSQTTPSTGYIVHPAFNFGGTPLSGIWVGKFEISHVDQTKSETSLGCTAENCENADNLRILPNVISLRNNNISNFFYGIRSMSRSGNAFGITDDTHMMKNSEWGAVAYLSQSKYGKYGNSNYSGALKEIYQNKSSTYITGSSNGTPSQEQTNSQCTYDTQTSFCGVGASTTGNITGIYDMSGGAIEFVMGVFSNGTSLVMGQSGFDSLNSVNQKYYDVYIIYGSGDKGHAISETSTESSGNSSWYNDTSNFVSSESSWFFRGGSHVDQGTLAGAFLFSNNTGALGNARTTRPVLVKTS